MKKILLTFDIEEADILNEYKLNVSKETELEISKQGFLRLINILKENNVKATLFVTANFAKRYTKLIRELSDEGHEIACHGYLHSDDYNINSNLIKISQAKSEIEKITKKEILGFRAPRFSITNIAELSNFNFKYDSSIHPTFASSGGKNLFKSRSVRKIGNVIEISPSTLPLLRLPISWIFFRNLGLTYSKTFMSLNNLSSQYTMFLFHPWEFADLDKFNLPIHIKRNTGLKLAGMLGEIIKFAKERGYEFETIGEYLKLNGK
jgi:peptidoglycan/xylan/chitin deacetylase (PgdA/CDA1 family)